jgi:TetR/AcrR family transcriptional regulator, upper aerobic nicotinate degradation pathway regulator
MSTRTPASAKPLRKTGVRERAAETTRENILRAAIKIFAKHGLDGGSIDQISKAANSHDRMIYYYFGNKEGLFVAALEETYRRFNAAEAALKLDTTQPLIALKQVVQFILRYYKKNPEFVTLLNSENLHGGKHIAKSNKAREYSSPAIGVVDQVLVCGIEQGVFRKDLSSRDLYMMIAALGYFYQSNRFTLSAFLGENLEAPATFKQWETFVVDTVQRTVVL